MSDVLSQQPHGLAGKVGQVAEFLSAKNFPGWGRSSDSIGRDSKSDQLWIRHSLSDNEDGGWELKGWPHASEQSST